MSSECADVSNVCMQTYHILIHAMLWSSAQVLFEFFDLAIPVDGSECSSRRACSSGQLGQGNLGHGPLPVARALAFIAHTILSTAISAKLGGWLCVSFCETISSLSVERDPLQLRHCPHLQNIRPSPPRRLKTYLCPASTTALAPLLVVMYSMFTSVTSIPPSLIHVYPQGEK